MSEILPTKPAQKKSFFFVGSENCSGGEKIILRVPGPLKKLNLYVKSRKIQKLFFV